MFLLLLSGPFQDILRKFDEGHYPWSRCFGKVYVHSALMPPEQDLYEPPKQQINRLWVNGPNRQFEKGLRACQFPTFSVHGYQLAYLMEPDSVPLRRFWLDRLLAEVEERRPFAVLGSKYRGDKWYDFIKQLEIPLLNHINGNAIYNVSHALMNLMLGQLEVEADQMYNFIPFDLRMGQMWTEGTLGIVQNMLPTGTLENVAASVVTPRNNTQLFQQWWDDFGFLGGANGTASSIQESTVIKNYAATNMLAKFLGPEIVIHGAAMFKRWEAERPMALVVSDWDEGFLDDFIESLSHNQHPFHEGKSRASLHTAAVRHRRDPAARVCSLLRSCPWTLLCTPLHDKLPAPYVRLPARLLWLFTFVPHLISRGGAAERRAPDSTPAAGWGRGARHHDKNRRPRRARLHGLV
jgi:hypothetical protein